ncbi:MAG: hypothetical protein DMF62_14450 [Acidobacteria bacterium]|nr:MAG: hypothetical protein DMF62_14450 [Acidobacteriota bacterium]
MNRAFLVFLACLFTVLFSLRSSEQQVRLRSELTPACTPVIESPNWRFSDIYADGNIAVEGSYYCRGAFIYDISNPDAPILAFHYNPVPVQQFLEAIVIGNRGYFGSGLGNGGVHIVDLTNPYAPVLLGVVDSTHGNGHNNIHEMMIFSQNGSTYLLENYNSTSADKRIKIIDITNPASPVFKWEFTVADNAWVHAMHIRGNRMFLSEYTGAKVEIYNISDLANQVPSSIGAVTANTTNHSSWTSEDGNYLYSCRETLDGDVRVYDIHDPQSPVLRKIIKAADLNINAVTPHNPIVLGNRLYVSWYQAGVQVFDISDPINPVRIGQYDTFQPAFDAEKAAERSVREEPWDMVCGAENLQNSLPSSYDGNWTVFPFLGEDRIIASDLTSGLLILDATGLNAPPKNVVSDFDGDRKTDLSIFNPNSGSWSVESTTSSTQFSVAWGLNGDVPVAADYDGDGRTDAAVWRPSNGRWYVANSAGGFSEVEWGLTGDIPVPGDYDADGKEDLAVWRPSNGTWYIRQSTLGIRVQPWGLNGDKPVVGDFEGDGKSDLGVWRPSEGTWYVLQSSSSQLIIRQWGLAGDKPLVTDFDGNGKAELSVFRPSNGTWYRLDVFTEGVATQAFGLNGDIPIPADYDGDGKTDVAVFRPTDSSWYRIDSGDSAFRVRTFGQTGVTPSPGSVQPH